MSDLYPCKKCKHMCAIDANRCPSCGTKEGFLTKSVVFFRMIGCFGMGWILLSTKISSAIGIFCIVCGIIWIFIFDNLNGYKRIMYKIFGNVSL